MDFMDTAESFAEILRHWGHDARAAVGAEDALALLGGWEPDAAVIDVCMPLTGGCHLVRKLSERFGARPLLIAITGWKKPSDRILAQLSGFDHHLPKPFEARELLALLEPLTSGDSAGR